MTVRIVDYKIAVHGSLIDLERGVREGLKDGYQPFGSMVLEIYTSYRGLEEEQCTQYMQPLVRYEEVP